MSIHWKIVSTDREVSDGCVFAIHYEVIAEEAGQSATIYGCVGVERSDDLIPFSDLDEETVTTWAKQRLGEDGVTLIEAELTAALEERLAPKVATGVPW